MQGTEVAEKFPTAKSHRYEVSDVFSFRDNGGNLRSQQVLRKGGRRGRKGGRKDMLCAGHSVSYATAICFNPHECPAKKALSSPSFRHKLRIRNSEELSLK